SLLATQLVSRVRELFGVEIALRAVFELPALSALAREVERAVAEGRGLAAPPITPVPREAGEAGLPELPLSFAQQRLWFLDQLEPGGAVYNIPLAFEARGPLDLDLLGRALTEVVRRHESLRTTFAAVSGRALQVIAPPSAFSLPLADLSAEPEADRERLARRRIAEEARRPFDLAAGPLFRGRVVRLAPERYFLALTMHHTVSDGWSTGILLAEVAALYTAFAADPSGARPSPLPELPIQYADFAAWQRAWLSGEVLETQVAYWREELSGASILELPADRPR